MSEFWWGVLTPFIVAGAIALAMLLVVGVFRLWQATDMRLIYKTDLRRDPLGFSFEEPEDAPPTYEHAAKKIYDSLLKSPRVYSVFGFGWIITFVRNAKGM